MPKAWKFWKSNAIDISYTYDDTCNTITTYHNQLLSKPYSYPIYIAEYAFIDDKLHTYVVNVDNGQYLQLCLFTSWNKNGNGSVGTLYREWSQTVGACSISLWTAKEITGECYKQYYDVNEYICALLNNPWGWLQIILMDC